MIKEILKQYVDVMATVVAGFMIVCILGYIVMHWDTVEVFGLVLPVIVLAIFMFFVFPTKEKGEST